jgi:hypothetical protein
VPARSWNALPVSFRVYALLEKKFLYDGTERTPQANLQKSQTQAVHIEDLEISLIDVVFIRRVHVQSALGYGKFALRSIDFQEGVPKRNL